MTNDSDVETANDNLTVSAISDPSNGAAVIAADNTTITYTPNDGFTGFDSFTYTVADGTGADALTDTGTATVSVAPVVFGSISIDYEENGTGSVATYTANGNPTWRLTGADRDAFSIDSGGVLTFNSPPDYESPADANTDNAYLLTVVATVQSGGSTVTVPLPVTVTVGDVTDPPTVTGLTQVDYAENSTGTVATYSATGSGGTISWSLEQNGDYGDFSIDDATGALTFASAPDYETPADANTDNVYQVTVQATEGGEVGELDVTITVTDLPGVSGPAVSDYPENGTVAVANYSATGAGGTISWSLSGADSRAFSITGGALTFASTPDHEEPDDEGGNNVYEVTVRADDSGEVGTLDVTVRVLNLVGLPTVVDDAVTTDEDTPVAIAVLDNDLIAEGGSTLSVTAVGTPTYGGAVNSAGNISYTPAEHFNGTDRFTYTISDGTNTATGTVTVTVAPVNDAPKAMADAVVTVANTAIVIDVVANDTDVDGDALSVKAVADAGNGNADFTARSSTEITYTPDPNFTGTDSFTYTVTDGTTTATPNPTVTVTVKEAEVENLVALSALNVSPGSGNETVELNKEFAENTTAYTMNVPNSVASLQVTPKKKFDTSDTSNTDATDDVDTAANVVVKITVNGTEVDSDSPIPLLQGGVTTIEIEVITTISPFEDVVTEVSETYTIVVSRSGRSGGSSPSNDPAYFTEGSETGRSVPENTPPGQNIGQPFQAEDPQGTPLIYGLYGADASFFKIDRLTGQLITQAPLDFETQSSYQVRVGLNGGVTIITVTVDVINVDEPGVVKLSQERAVVGVPVTATLTDPDGGVANVAWQWSASSDGVTWIDIPGATGSTYTPVDLDQDQFLRAAAVYSDNAGSGAQAQVGTENLVQQPSAPTPTPVTTGRPPAPIPTPAPTRTPVPPTIATPAPQPTATLVPSPASIVVPVLVPTPQPTAASPVPEPVGASVPAPLAAPTPVPTPTLAPAPLAMTGPTPTPAALPAAAESAPLADGGGFNPWWIALIVVAALAVIGGLYALKRRLTPN